jgi:hypothetical protein
MYFITAPSIRNNNNNLTPKHKTKELQNLVLDELINIHEQNKQKKHGDIQRFIDLFSDDFPCVSRHNFNNGCRARTGLRKVEMIRIQRKAAKTLSTMNSVGPSGAVPAIVERTIVEMCKESGQAGVPLNQSVNDY